MWSCTTSLRSGRTTRATGGDSFDRRHHRQAGVTAAARAALIGQPGLLKHLHHELRRDQALPPLRQTSKRPQRGVAFAGVLYPRILHARALGAFGSLGARHLSTLSRIAFPNLCQIAHKVAWQTCYPQTGKVSRFAQFHAENKA
jgi:hypothetical protein